MNMSATQILAVREWACFRFVNRYRLFAFDLHWVYKRFHRDPAKRYILKNCFCSFCKRDDCKFAAFCSDLRCVVARSWYVAVAVVYQGAVSCLFILVPSFKYRGFYADLFGFRGSSRSSYLSRIHDGCMTIQRINAIYIYPLWLHVIDAHQRNVKNTTRLQTSYACCSHYPLSSRVVGIALHNFELRWGNAIIGRCGTLSKVIDTTIYDAWSNDESDHYIG